jgi:hypothetical protein
MIHSIEIVFSSFPSSFLHINRNMDHTALLGLAKDIGHVSREKVLKELGWSADRLVPVIQLLLEEGIAWVDGDVHGEDALYWFPCLCDLGPST